MFKTEAVDGLEALRSELDLRQIMRLIERTARWVAPETFQRLPIWFPEHARRGLFYRADWSQPQMNKNRETGESVHKREGNLYANKALTQALGLRTNDRPNWSCCHIWGVDDATYATTNLVVQDAKFYSCVANLLLLPTPLKAFTDVMPEVKAMLRACAASNYGWRCDHPALASGDDLAARSDPAYPASWPRRAADAPPPGTAPFTPGIEARATRRLAAIRRDLDHAGPHYPREQVLTALQYWNVRL